MSPLVGRTGCPLRRCAPVPPRGSERLGSGPAALIRPTLISVRYFLQVGEQVALHRLQRASRALELAVVDTIENQEAQPKFPVDAVFGGRRYTRTIGVPLILC